MEIRMSIREIMDKHLWEEYCRLTGTNVWAVNEGQLDSDAVVTVPEPMVKLVIRLS